MQNKKGRLLMSCHQVPLAEYFGISLSRLNQISTQHGLGFIEGGGRRYTTADIEELRLIRLNTRMGNPNWVKGKPQPHRQKKEDNGAVLSSEQGSNTVNAPWQPKQGDVVTSE